MTPMTSVPKTPTRPEKKKRDTVPKKPQPQPDFSFLDGLTTDKLKAVKKLCIQEKQHLKVEFDNKAVDIKSLQDQIALLKAAQKKNYDKRVIVGLQSRAVNLRIRDIKKQMVQGSSSSSSDDEDEDEDEDGAEGAEGDQRDEEEDEEEAEAEADEQQPTPKKMKI